MTNLSTGSGRDLTSPAVETMTTPEPNPARPVPVGEERAREVLAQQVERDMAAFPDYRSYHRGRGTPYYIRDTQHADVSSATAIRAMLQFAGETVLIPQAQAGRGKSAALATEAQPSDGAGDPLREDMVMLPREPTPEMMNAGLYQSSHDSTYADVHSIWKAMFDAVALDGGSSDHLPATPKAPQTDAAGEVAWRAGRDAAIYEVIDYARKVPQLVHALFVPAIEGIAATLLPPERFATSSPTQVAAGGDLSDEQWAQAVANAPKPDGPLTPILTPPVPNDDLRAAGIEAALSVIDTFIEASSLESVRVVAQQVRNTVSAALSGERKA